MRPGESPHCGGEGEADPIDSPKKAGRARRKSGKGIRSRGDLKDEEIYYKPLTHGLAAKVMLFASVMLASATSLMSSFSLDDRDGLWEMACAPHSWLSDAASRQGLNPRRINLEAGFDLYKKKRPGITFETSGGNIVLDVFGFHCLALSGVSGLL